MYLPEAVIIQQGEIGEHLYFIAKGEAEIYIKDHSNKEMFQRTLGLGHYFGEMSLITKQRRSATAKSKNYNILGYITLKNFEEIVFLFPDTYQAFKNGMKDYNDSNKLWLKDKLKNIVYLKEVDNDTLEELSYCMFQEFYSVNQRIIQKDTICD